MAGSQCHGCFGRHSCTLGFKTIHRSVILLGIKPHWTLHADSRRRYLTPRGRGGSRMSRRVKEFVDIGEHVSLDDLIGKLAAVRAELPEGCEAEMRLRGDEVFGRRITISYFRDQTDEEAEIERRYAEQSREAKERELERLQA